jgi:hypothetical protein
MQKTISPEINWFDKNWKWFVPVTVLSAMIILALIVSGIGYTVMRCVKSSDVYKTSIHLVETDSRALELLGAPIEAKWYVMGNMNVSGSSGSADLSIPLRGSRRKGIAYVEAVKRMGKWHVKNLVLELKDSSERVTLVHEGRRLSLDYQI